MYLAQRTVHRSESIIEDSLQRIANCGRFLEINPQRALITEDGSLSLRDTHRRKLTQKIVYRGWFIHENV